MGKEVDVCKEIAEKVFLEEVERWKKEGFSIIHSSKPSDDIFYEREVGENLYCIQVIIIDIKDDFVFLLMKQSGPGISQYTFLSKTVYSYADGRIDA